MTNKTVTSYCFVLGVSVLINFVIDQQEYQRSQVALVLYMFLFDWLVFIN